MDETFVDVAREYIKLITGELQPYVSEKITVLVDSKSKVSFFTPDHIQFAKYGRGAGKMPPVDAILRFVKKNGIIFDKKTQEQTAWAIAFGIAKNGTLNYVPNAPNALEEALKKGNKEYMERLSKFSSRRTLEEIQLIYEENLPRNIKLQF